MYDFVAAQTFLQGLLGCVCEINTHEYCLELLEKRQNNNLANIIMVAIIIFIIAIVILIPSHMGKTVLKISLSAGFKMCNFLSEKQVE